MKIEWRLAVKSNISDRLVAKVKQMPRKMFLVSDKSLKMK